jgi:hypothetical protein
VYLHTMLGVKKNGATFFNLHIKYVCSPENGENLMSPGAILLLVAGVAQR